MSTTDFGWRRFCFDDVEPWAGPPLPPLGPSPDAERWIERAAGHPTLAALVAPSSVATFFREHWEHRPLVARGPELELDATRILAAAARRPELVDRRGRSAVIVAHAERLDVHVAALTTALEDLFLAPVSANLFVSAPGDPALPTHWDNQEVFVVQLSGAKRWRLGTPREPLAWRDRVPGDGDTGPCTEVLLEAGDRLYLPRGHPHAADAADGPSIHLSVALHPPTALDAARLALEAAIAERAERGELRRFFPGLLWGGGEERLAPLVSEVAASLTDDAIRDAMRAHLARLDHDGSYLAREAERRRRLTLAHEQDRGLGADTLLVRTTGLGRLRTTGQIPLLEVRGLSVPVPPALEPAVRAWLERPRATPREVAGGAELEAVVALAELLVTIGLLTPEAGDPRP